jgi:AcrR family transcriptional regulator
MVARTHGWQGNLPTDDEEAVARILAATRTCIDAYGSRTSISDVADEVGVTRQTIYRYFSSTEDLLKAVAIDATGAFLDRIAAHVSAVNDPVEVLLESIAFTVERLPRERYLSASWGAEPGGAAAIDTSSDVAIALGRGLFEQWAVRWPDSHLDDAAADELVEWNLRALQSLLLDPGHPPRRGKELRRFLAAWQGPALAARLGVPAPAVDGPVRRRQSKT